MLVALPASVAFGVTIYAAIDPHLRGDLARWRVCSGPWRSV